MKRNHKLTSSLIALLCALLIWNSSLQKTIAFASQGPSGVTATDRISFVQLDWQPDPMTQVAGYNIYRSANGFDHWKKLNQKLVISTSFVDYSAPRSELVFYRVNSVREDGEEYLSSSVTSLSTLPFATLTSLNTSQPPEIILSASGTSTISWVFDSTGWQQTFGSSLHTGDDDYAQDWSRSSGQTAGQNAYAAISGVVAKSYFSSSTYGNTVVVYDSEHGFAVRYAHLQARSVTEGQTVDAGTTIIGQVGNSGSTPDNPFNPHLHIVLYRNVTGTDGRPISFVSLSDSNSPYRAPFVFTADRVQGCASGSTTLRNRDGGPPVHPPGSLIKIASDPTVYLIDSDNQKRPITSSSVLAQLYNQSTDARTGTNFTNWVTIVAQDELDLYETGGNLSAALPGNGQPFPDGKLIGYNGEVSIVTGGGKRRPFVTESTFTGLGFKFCQVVNVSFNEYNAYPVGPPVDAMPILTVGVSLSPAAPYSVGQSISGSFTIKNVGFQSLPLQNLGIAGRFNGVPYDMNFVSTTLSPGGAYTYNSQPLQLNNTGAYEFSAAYQESNGHWAIRVPAPTGIFRVRQITVSNNVPSAPTANAATNVTSNSFTANWSSSSGATGYRLDVSTSSSFGSFVSGYQDLDVGNTTSRSVTGLNANTTYYYRVRAYNSSGTSSSSNTVTASTSTAPGGNAIYDSTFMAPKCGQPGSSCDSGALLVGRGNVSGGPETNQPNTLYNTCADSSAGTYHVDESIDSIKVSTLDGTDFASGKAVRIDVNFWAWSTTSDFLDLYYTSNAASPTWTYLATFQPAGTGAQVLTTTYQLPAGGSLQAVRAVFRYQGTASACNANSGYDDYDDLVFTLEGGGTSAVNVALTANGGVASAQNYTQDGVYPGLHFQPLYANDGVRFTSANGDRYWRDEHGLPTWLQIDFNGAKTITEVDVYTMADNYAVQSDPAPNQTFASYGVTAYDVQYWTGSNWTTVPGGSVTSNNLVGRKITFGGITTSKIRVVANATTDGVSRIVEVEAWSTTATPPPTINVALTANGGVATAQNYTQDGVYPGLHFQPLYANDGVRFTSANGDRYWRDEHGLPTWLQIDFNGAKTITEVDVYTMADNYAVQSDPAPNQTFASYGVTAYDVQYWTGSNWTTVPGGSVTSNNLVGRKITFGGITTSKIRVVANATTDGVSRIVEVEAWGNTPLGP